MTVKQIETHFYTLQEKGILGANYKIMEIRIYHNKVRRCFLTSGKSLSPELYFDEKGQCFGVKDKIHHKEFDYGTRY